MVWMHYRRRCWRDSCKPLALIWQRPHERTVQNPYPGLRPFQEAEEHLFFGRERHVDAMVDKLAETRFLAVVGTSGSGKSSLVNCGLRPALHRGLMTSAGTRWRMAQCRPGNGPLAALATALQLKGALHDSMQGRFQLSTFSQHFADERRGWSMHLQQARRRGSQPAGRDRPVRGAIPISALGTAVRSEQERHRRGSHRIHQPAAGGTSSTGPSRSTSR